jgi:hypothetical protein
MQMTKTLATTLLLASACFAQQYTPDGDLQTPKDYREWVFLTSSLGLNYSTNPNPDPEFDNVFVNPAAYQAFLKTGAWPDKTVLIKENRSSEKHAASKDGRFQTHGVGMEVHVKDASKGGWKYYIFPKDAQTGKVVKNQAGCDNCHSKAAVDFTFVEFYPTLIDAAKKNGTWHDPR